MLTRDVLGTARFPAIEPTDIAAFAHIKRFSERWVGDRAFREAYPKDPTGVGAEFGLQADPEDLRVLWDADASGDGGPLMARYAEFFNEAFRRDRARLAATTSTDARFARWRERQVYRHNLEVGVSLYPNPHIPASFELARGCSVGCWFCSVNPPKLSDRFDYTPGNGALWRGLLGVLREVLGPAAVNSICYSGTDPFDSPDYERFAADFEAALGEPPFTSTALAARDPERVRRLLARFGPHRARFSILSLGMLNRLHAAFSAEELLLTNLSFRNEGSLETKHLAFAGRARERATTYEKYHPGAPVIDTPSCETGFKFNLPDRAVRLSSPCAPDDRWPNGFRVYDEAVFETADDAGRIMEDMIERHMPMRAPRDGALRFHRALRLEAAADGVALVGPYMTQRFENTAESPFLGRTAQLIGEGQCDAARLAGILEGDFPGSRAGVMSALDDFFRLGLLDDEPAQSASSRPGKLRSPRRRWASRPSDLRQ